MPGLNVLVSGGPPPEAWTQIYDYSGNNLVYTGWARSSQSPPQTLNVTSVSKAVAAVAAVTAHGLLTGATVNITGATGDWAALNGTQTVTSTGANTFTVPVNSSGFAGTFDGVITTASPQTSRAIWTIQKNFYNGSNQIINTMWAVGVDGIGGAVGQVNIWDNRATLKYS